MDYGHTFLKLTYETATVVFMKKDGTIRVMLATRNIKTARLDFGELGGLLSGHDNRCSIKNGNVGVIDLTLGDVRAFNIERVVDIHFYGEIEDKETLDRVYDTHREFKEKYESTKPMELNMDLLT